MTRVSLDRDQVRQAVGDLSRQILRDGRVQTPPPSIVSPLRTDIPVRAMTHRVALNAYGRLAELTLPIEFTARDLDRIEGYVALLRGVMDDTPAPEVSDAEG